ncbi:Coagulation factor 5/8 type-like protein [Tuwongella immobilis]|uniref:Uncharacterized protein n=1 Tax=Tuwongella immobilis TaxID=692036 RepID=A0A6C2YI23_9BACT|nr:Coagulation factor 5/8 type-like protein [Tuwongella immobilis]VIP01180.1 Putative Coagulation factor 5/8 type-like protein OS=[Oscillatoria] sp. PCC 6506 GN=OSCI_1420018 PE=4 SV=1 [Tuwongella immobilis]VTR97786.1 Putative Coagulation factor 5/8 type-like protein OS=[Oscillatoria] sp. PCC 6506 GN=OSCI_1420018 PE=4 SV=1 [Tuwongella immobilis]
MLMHEFLLLPESGHDYSDYLNYLHAPNARVLHDDIVLYLMDTLRWVPSINPANPKHWSGFGLNYDGPTIITKSGAAKAERIFRLWAALLQEGPDTLELTGGFEWAADAPSSSGQYAVITATRNSVVECLTDIADFAEKASTGRAYLLHLGI